MDCETCHPPAAVHSASAPTGPTLVSLYPTAQHSEIDGHETPVNVVAPDAGCAASHDDPFHSTAARSLLLFCPTAQHSVVDGHDMPSSVLVPDIDCASPQDDPVHSASTPTVPTLMLLCPTAQHSEIDGHDIPFH